jgi:hypothetical protein
VRLSNRRLCEARAGANPLVSVFFLKLYGDTCGLLLVLTCLPLATWAYFTLVHGVTVAGDRYHVPSVLFIAMSAHRDAIGLRTARSNTAATRGDR